MGTKVLFNIHCFTHFICNFITVIIWTSYPSIHFFPKQCFFHFFWSFFHISSTTFHLGGSVVLKMCIILLPSSVQWLQNLMCVLYVTTTHSLVWWMLSHDLMSFTFTLNPIKTQFNCHAQLQLCNCIIVFYLD